MKLVVLISIFMSVTSYASSQVKSQIHEIDYGLPGEETLLFLNSGQVIPIKNSEAKTIQDFEFAQKNQKWLEFKLTDRHEIENYKVLKHTSPSTKNLSSFKSPNEDFVPTVVENIDLLKTYFHEAKYVNKDSQCYNRAHIWTYEWFTKNAINSNKTWLFFTRKYIRKFKFEWWFHVSPSIGVMEDGVIREKIMDVKYARDPIDLKNWTDIFMRDDANCPMVKNYSDYANYPETGSCFTMRSSMYHYQPVDIESKETWGTTKASWYDSEIKQAYLEAFDEVL
jgi:hypothetical protein